MDMRKLLATILSLTSLYAQDISGNWQGTLGERTDRIRMVLRIERRHSAWTARLFSIDQSPDWGAGQALTAPTPRSPRSVTSGPSAEPAQAAIAAAGRAK